MTPLYSTGQGRKAGHKSPTSRPQTEYMYCLVLFYPTSRRVLSNTTRASLRCRPGLLRLSTHRRPRHTSSLLRLYNSALDALRGWRTDFLPSASHSSFPPLSAASNLPAPQHQPSTPFARCGEPPSPVCGALPASKRECCCPTPLCPLSASPPAILIF